MPTDTERDQAITSAHDALKKAKTADQVRAVWSEHYLIIGHRILGRLLIGQDIDSATRHRKEQA